MGGVLAIAAELSKAGAEARLWSGEALRPRVAGTGVQFCDLFNGRTPSLLGDTSIPMPARQVTFAAKYAESLAAEMRAWSPALIVVEGFTLIGSVAAELLGKPWVLINAGHNVNGAAHRRAIAEEFPSNISGACWAAVDILKSRYGLSDASPYSYISEPSPWSTIFLEPREWQGEAERLALRNIEFFGSSPGGELPRERSARQASTRKVYASFGTVVWRYWKNETLAILRSIADGVALAKGASLTIGLGGASLSDHEMTGLLKHGATVIPYADQPAILRESSVFITHHGLGSTHEAVAAQVPMLSYPLFGDQPGLAALSLSFGLAKPLRDMNKPFTCVPSADQVALALDAVFADSEAMRERLSEACKWERCAIAARPAAAKRLIKLAQQCA
jgi:UDP:flavonoid glycosyltransferase YjiC (YdhE family)